MNQISDKPDWVGSYLEWMRIEFSYSPKEPTQEILDSNLNGSEEFSLAYFEWMDADRPKHETVAHRVSAISGNTQRGLDALREAMLLAALRTESECLHILRHSVDAGHLTTQTVELAFEVLEHAGRLLEDERDAWQTLSALRHSESPRMYARRQSDHEQDWPQVLEHMAADMHALTGKVLALRVA